MAMMSEHGKDAKTPDLWRMSALLEICPKDVKKNVNLKAKARDQQDRASTMRAQRLASADGGGPRERQTGGTLRRRMEAKYTPKTSNTMEDAEKTGSDPSEGPKGGRWGGPKSWEYQGPKAIMTGNDRIELTGRPNKTKATNSCSQKLAAM